MSSLCCLMRGTPAALALGGQYIYRGAFTGRGGRCGPHVEGREWSGYMQQLLCVHAASGSILCLGRTVGKTLLLPQRYLVAALCLTAALSLPASLERCRSHERHALHAVGQAWCGQGQLPLCLCAQPAL